MWFDIYCNHRLDAERSAAICVFLFKLIKKLWSMLLVHGITCASQIVVMVSHRILYKSEKRVFGTFEFILGALE